MCQRPRLSRPRCNLSKHCTPGRVSRGPGLGLLRIMRSRPLCSSHSHLLALRSSRIAPRNQTGIDSPISTRQRNPPGAPSPLRPPYPMLLARPAPQAPPHRAHPPPHPHRPLCCLCSSNSQLQALRRSRITAAQPGPSGARPQRASPISTTARQKNPAPSSSSAPLLPAPSSRCSRGCAQQVGHRAACLLDGLTRAALRSGFARHRTTSDCDL